MIHRGGRAGHAGRLLGSALLAATALAGALACERSSPSTQDDGGPSLDAGPAITPAVVPSVVFQLLKTGAAAHTDLCANDFLHPDFPRDADIFIRVFCADLVDGGVAPVPRSLTELETLLGLGFTDPGGQEGAGGNPGFALLGHSSSLVARHVSALNPRAIVFTPPLPDGGAPPDYVLLAYARGDTFVEVAAHDAILDKVVFYLITFTPPCAAGSAGCTPSDLLTPAIETGWQSSTAYTAATEINDTILDCFQCHQTRGSTTPAFLRMQENSPPFTHFFSAVTEGGRALLADYHGAHGTAEDYAGIPAGMIDQSDPALLAALIQAAGFGQQPNAFSSATIEAEVKASAPGQPESNVPMGQSATWATIYAEAKAGRAIAVPYHDVKVTDPDKLAAASQLYQSVRQGRAPASALTDFRDVFYRPGLSDMGFAPAGGLDGRALLVQSCQQCHNSNLDQTISRALFNVPNLDLLPASRKQEAIRRLKIVDPNDPAMMPPPLFRTLTDSERALMIQELGR